MNQTEFYKLQYTYVRAIELYRLYRLGKSKFPWKEHNRERAKLEFEEFNIQERLKDEPVASRDYPMGTNSNWRRNKRTKTKEEIRKETYQKALDSIATKKGRK